MHTFDVALLAGTEPSSLPRPATSFTQSFHLGPLQTHRTHASPLNHRRCQILATWSTSTKKETGVISVDRGESRLCRCRRRCRYRLPATRTALTDKSPTTKPVLSCITASTQGSIGPPHIYASSPVSISPSPNKASPVQQLACSQTPPGFVPAALLSVSFKKSPILRQSTIGREASPLHLIDDHACAANPRLIHIDGSPATYKPNTHHSRNTRPTTCRVLRSPLLSPCRLRGIISGS